MTKKITIAIDAMGGENSPNKTIEGTCLFIKKNNLKNDFTGKITEICKNKLCLKVNNYNVKINPNHYYIFIKPNTSKKNDRHFFESLLKVL